MEIHRMTKEEWNSFVTKLIEESPYEVIGVKAKGHRFIFDILETVDELRLDYDVTILPPKKYFLPQYETLLRFDLKKPFAYNPSKPLEKPRILIGVHPYDIIALQQADRVYLDSLEDEFYRSRRDETLIIGVDIQRVSEHSFAASLGTHIVDSGFDLLLTNLGEHYAITIGSDRGRKLLEEYGSSKPATKRDIEKIKEVREEITSRFQKKVDTRDWSKLLNANYDHSIWDEKSSKCLECGSCVMVCPTCFCYDVKDEVTLTLDSGERIRTWDACLFREFTMIGGGKVFREDKSDRFRHRFYRKGSYLVARYGFIACVGCGRCSIACLPGIADPCKLINELSKSKQTKGSSGRFYIEYVEEEEKRESIHLPRSATIIRVEKLTERETLFEIQLDDGKPLNHIPGQFVEVSIFGVGEAPLSISSMPRDTPSFEIVVRQVGNVTTRLSKMKPGDKIGIRGPLGRGFDVKSFEGKNLLLSAGGIGIIPMRSLIQYVLAEENRDRYGDVMILYGARRPKELLFRGELEEWSKIEGVTCELTVDECDEDDCWTGCTGLITTLYPKIRLDRYASLNTIAVVIGPPVMYKFVIKCLQTLGIPDENIYVSLERRMKCGVGKCGHCQINGVYVCKEGPVFNYNEIKHLPEAFE